MTAEEAVDIQHDVLEPVEVPLHVLTAIKQAAESGKGHTSVVMEVGWHEDNPLLPAKLRREGYKVLYGEIAIDITWSLW